MSGRRIRTVKPEIFDDELFASRPAIYVKVFIGLILLADDAGRLIDNLKQIDAALFPQTRESAKQALDLFTEKGRIIRYRGPDGQRLLQIRNFRKHQVINRPSKRVLPAPVGFTMEGFPVEGYPGWETLSEPSVRLPGAFSEHAAQVSAAGTDASAQERSGERETDQDKEHGAGTMQPTAIRREQRSVSRKTTAASSTFTAAERPSRFELAGHPGLVAFLTRFYGFASDREMSDRQLDVAAQAIACLTAPGAIVSREIGFALAASPRHLNQVAAELAKSLRLKNPDAAVTVLLKRIRETRTDALAEEHRAEVRMAEKEYQAELSAALTWVTNNPDVRDRLQRTTSSAEVEGGSTSNGLTGAFAVELYERAAVDAYRQHMRGGDQVPSGLDGSLRSHVAPRPQEP